MAIATSRRRRDGISYRSFDSSWYSSITGRKLPLRDEAGEKIKGLAAEPEAKRAYYRLAALRPEERLTALESPASISVGELCGRYFVDRGGSTNRRTKQYLQAFLAGIGSGTPAMAIRSRHLENWIEKQAAWNHNTSNRAIAAVLAAYNWGIKHELIPNNPLQHVSRPARTSRIVVISEEDEKQICEIIKPAAQDFFRFLILTGCRPYSEGGKIEAKHCREVPGCGIQITLPAVGEGGKLTGHKTAQKTGRDRIIYISHPEAIEILRRRIALFPTGSIFRSEAGAAWDEFTAGGQMRRAVKKLGLNPQYTPYACRHTCASRMLANGASIAEVAAMLGNSIQVCEKHYAHLQVIDSAMWRAAGRIQ